MQEFPVCMWCSRPAIQSHVIPRTVLRTLTKVRKEQQRFRNATAPRKVVQDFVKEPLLCKICDNNFSDVESLFRRKLYYPLLTGSTEFTYGPWLLRFAVFMSWKVAATHKEPSTQSQKDEWQAFLQGRSASPGTGEHHVVFTHDLDPSSDELIQVLLRELTRFGVYEFGGDGQQERSMVLSAIPGMIFASALLPTDIGKFGWHGTKINTNGTLSVKEQSIKDSSFGLWINDALNIARIAARKL